MAGLVFTARVTLLEVTVGNVPWRREDTAYYFLGKIAGHPTGRSAELEDGSSKVELRGDGWAQELRVEESPTLALEITAWERDKPWLGPRSKAKVEISKSEESPAGSSKQVLLSEGLHLRYRLEHLAVLADASDRVRPPRIEKGGGGFTTLVIPRLPVVDVIEILGLYRPRRRADAKTGTVRHSEYELGYTSQDDLGRVYTNRLPDGTWKPRVQYIDLRAEVSMQGWPLPAGGRIAWSVEILDDISNEDPHMHPDTGRLLDPSDYEDGGKGGAWAETEPTGRFEAIGDHKLEDDRSSVDPKTGISRVRLHFEPASGIAFRIRATFEHPSFSRSVPFFTGRITVWDRIEIEYVKMKSAKELPVEEVSKHFELARVQFDVSERRELEGEKADLETMDRNNKDNANARCETFCKAPPEGHFKHSADGGWFFAVAARTHHYRKPIVHIHEGDASIRGGAIRVHLPPMPKPEPTAVRIYNPAKVDGGKLRWTASNYIGFEIKNVEHTLVGYELTDAALERFHQELNPSAEDLIQSTVTQSEQSSDEDSNDPIDAAALLEQLNRPADRLEELDEIKGRRFEKDAPFIELLERTLGQEQASRHREAILQHASLWRLDLTVEKKSYFPVDKPTEPFHKTFGEYGFTEGQKIRVQIRRRGPLAGAVTGHNAGTDHPTLLHQFLGGLIDEEAEMVWFAGLLLVFTDAIWPDDEPAPKGLSRLERKAWDAERDRAEQEAREEALQTLCHEFAHAYGTAHICGNWDWRHLEHRTSCCMNYFNNFILDSAERPIPWTQNRMSAELCGEHLQRLREVQLIENPTLKKRWGIK